jgi:hypothetical protein
MKANANAMNIASLVLTCLAILLSFYFFHSDINKKLEYLIDREAGTLTYSQAMDLTDLYLSAIQADLRVAMLESIPQLLPEVAKRRDDPEAKRQVYRIVDSVIAAKRTKLASFRIAGGQNCKDFLDKINPIDGDVIGGSKEKSYTIISTSLGPGPDVQSIESKLGLIAQDAERESSQIIKAELDRRYGPK